MQVDQYDQWFDNSIVMVVLKFILANKYFITIY
jgi:hypothetical protein